MATNPNITGDPTPGTEDVAPESTGPSGPGPFTPTDKPVNDGQGVDRGRTEGDRENFSRDAANVEASQERGDEFPDNGSDDS